MQREFDASNTLSLYYEGAAGSRWQRVDVGNVTFTPPPSRFLIDESPHRKLRPPGHEPIRSAAFPVDFRPAEGEHRPDAPVHHRQQGRAGQCPRHRRLSDRAAAVLLHGRSGAPRGRPRVSEHRHPEPLAARRALAVAARHAPADQRSPLSPPVRDAAAESQRAAFPCAGRPDERHGGLRPSARRRGLRHRSVAPLVRARPAAERDERAARRRLQRQGQRQGHRLGDDRRHARPPIHPGPRPSRQPRHGPDGRPDVGRVPQRDSLGLPHRGEQPRARVGDDSSRHRQRAPRASHRRTRRDVPRDVRARPVGESRRVRRRESSLAAAQRRDLQPRRRGGRHPQRRHARRRVRDPRLLPRLPVAASVQRARLGARRAGQSDERRHLQHPRRIHLLAAASGVAVSDEHSLPDRRHRDRRRDFDRRRIDSAGLGASGDGRPSARARPRLPHRLRHRAHRLHAARHALHGGAARRRALRGERVVRPGPDDARRVSLRAAGVARHARFSRHQPVAEHVVHAPGARASGQLDVDDGRHGPVQLGPARPHAVSPAACRSDNRRRRHASRSPPRSRTAIRSSSRATRARRTSKRSTPTAARRSRSPIRRGCTAAFRRTAIRCARLRRHVLRSIARGDARMADERAESRRPTPRRHGQRDRSAARRSQGRASNWPSRCSGSRCCRSIRSAGTIRRRAPTSGRTTASPPPRRSAFAAFARCSARRASTSRAANSSQFWTLLDTTAVSRAPKRTRRSSSISATSPRTRWPLRRTRSRSRADRPASTRTFSGKRLAGFDNPVPATERDPFSRSFNAAINDTGLPGDVADTHRRGRRVGRASRHQRAHLPRCSGRARRDRRPAHQLHDRQQQARRIRHRRRQRAQLLERAARERATASLRRRPERCQRVHAGRRPVHRHDLRARRAAAAHAQLGARTRSVQDAHRFAQRRESPQAARAPTHRRVGAGNGRRGPGAVADRRAAGDRRTVARPEQSDARGNRRNPPGRRIRDHVDDRHDGLQRVGRLSAAAGHRRTKPRSRARSFRERSRRPTRARCACKREICRSITAPKRSSVFRPARSTSWRFSGSTSGGAAAGTAGDRAASSRCTSRSGATRTTSTCTARRPTPGRRPPRGATSRSISINSSICARRSRRRISPEARRRSPVPASTRRSSSRRRCRRAP